MKNKIIFTIILIIGITIRIINFPNAIAEANCDEIMTAVNAKTIVDFGTDIYGTSYPVYLEAWKTAGQSVMLMYIMAIFIKIFGYSILTVRLPMLIISIITIIIFYDFAKRISKNEKIALLAMAMVIITPWHILQSIWSIDCNLFPHFLLISIYLLYRGITEKKWLIYLSMIFFALTMYTYGPAIYFVPLFLITSAIYLKIKKEITIKEIIICIAIYTLISTPIILMYIINYFKIDNINIGKITIQYFKESTRNNDMLLFSENKVTQLIKNINKTISAIIKQNDNLVWNATKYFGTTYHISLIFILISIIYLIKTRKNKKDFGIFLIITWFIISIILGLLINDTNINRLNCIWYPMIALTTYGIYITYKITNKNKLFKYFIITLYAILFLSYSIYFFTTHCHTIEDSWCFTRGYLDAIHYADELSKENSYFINLRNDFSLNVYAQFQTTIDNKNIKEISTKDNLFEKINYMNENDCFIYNNKILNIEIINPKIKIKQFKEFTVLSL